MRVYHILRGFEHKDTESIYTIQKTITRDLRDYADRYISDLIFLSHIIQRVLHITIFTRACNDHPYARGAHQSISLKRRNV